MRLEHGGVAGDCDGVNGDSCTYTSCDVGFQLTDSGELNRTCGNRAYSGEPKRCVPITCPTVRLENGRVDGGCNGVFNSTCSYLECDPGYRMVVGGADTRTCGEDGLYSGDARRCARDLRTVAGICTSTGDPHFNSFDNRHFNYQTLGLHHLVRADNLNVQVRHSRWGRGRASLNTWVAVSGEGMDNDVIEVYTGTTRRDSGVMLLNRRSVPWSPSTFVRYAAANASEIVYTLEILQNGHITLTLNDTARILIGGDTRRFLNIYVTLPGTYRADALSNGTSGLCGRFDGDRSTDPTDDIRIDDPCRSLFSAFDAECDGGSRATSTPQTGITINPPGGDPGGGTGTSSTTTSPVVTLPPIFTICPGECDDGGGGPGFSLPPIDWTDFDVDDDSLAVRVRPPGSDQDPAIDEFDPNDPDDCSSDHLVTAQQLCSTHEEEPEAHLDCLTDICLTLGGEEDPGLDNTTAIDVNDLVTLVQGMTNDAVTVGGAEVDHVAEYNAVKCPRLNLPHGSVAGGCDGKLADICVYEKCDLGFQLSVGGDSVRSCVRLNTTDATTFALTNDTTVPGEYNGAQKQCLMEPTLSLATAVGRGDGGDGFIVTRDETMTLDVEVYVYRGERSAHVVIELPHWAEIISSEITRVGEHIVEPNGGLQIVDERHNSHDNTFVLDIGTVLNGAGAEPGVAPPPITSADGVRVRVSARITDAARTADVHFIRAAMLTASTRVTGQGVSVTVAEPAVDMTLAAPEHISGGDQVSILTEIRNLGTGAAHRFQASCRVPGIIIDAIITNSSVGSVGQAVRVTHSAGEDAASSQVTITLDSLDVDGVLVLSWQGQAVDGLEAGATMFTECDTLWHSLSNARGNNYQTTATGELYVSPIVFGFDQGGVEVATEDGAAIGIPFDGAATARVTVAVPPGTIITNYSLAIQMSNPAFVVKTVELLAVGTGIELHTDGLRITNYDPESDIARRARRDENASVGDSGGEGAVLVSGPEVRSRLNVSEAGPSSGSEGSPSVAANEIVFATVIENSAGRSEQRWQGQSAVLETTMTSIAGFPVTSASDERYVVEEPDIHVEIVSSVDGDGDVVFNVIISHSVQSTADALNVTTAVAVNSSTVDSGRLMHSSVGGSLQIEVLVLRQSLQHNIVVGHSDGMRLQGEVCIGVTVAWASLGNDYVATVSNCRSDLTASSTTVPANLGSSKSSTTEDETGTLIAIIMTLLLLAIVVVALVVFRQRHQRQLEARNASAKGTLIPFSTLDRPDQRDVLPFVPSALETPTHRFGSIYLLEHPTAEESTTTEEPSTPLGTEVPPLELCAPHHEQLNDTREFALDPAASSLRLKSVARTNPMYVAVPSSSSPGLDDQTRSDSYAEALDTIADEDVEAGILGTSVHYRGGTNAVEARSEAATIQRSTATLVAGETAVEPAAEAAEAAADSSEEGELYPAPSQIAEVVQQAPAVDTTDGRLLCSDEGGPAPAALDSDDDEGVNKYGVVLSGPRAAAKTPRTGVGAKHSIVRTPDGHNHEYEYDGQRAAGADYQEPVAGAEPDYDRPAGDATYDNTAAVPEPIYGVPEEPPADVYGLGPTRPTSAVYGLGPPRPASEVYQMADHNDTARRNSDDDDNAEFYPMAMQDDAAGQAAGVGTAGGAPGPAYSIATFDRRGSGGGYRAPKQRAVTGDYSNVVIDVDDGVNGVYGLQRDGHGSTYGNPRPPDATEGNYGLGD
jgi:hypothetical protein